MDGLVNINPSILGGVIYFYTTKTQRHKDLVKNSCCKHCTLLYLIEDK